MILLQKKFRFETAHRLAKGYEGKCANIHGHSWNGHIEVECSETDEYDMGVDYGILKAILKKVEDKYDHKLVLWTHDPIAKVFKDADFHNGIVQLTANPTSETIAEDIYGMVEALIDNMDLDCRLVSVNIEETCTVRCSYKR